MHPETATRPRRRTIARVVFERLVVAALILQVALLLGTLHQMRKAGDHLAQAGVHIDNIEADFRMLEERFDRIGATP